MCSVTDKEITAETTSERIYNIKGNTLSQVSVIGSIEEVKTTKTRSNGDLMLFVKVGGFVSE